MKQTKLKRFKRILPTLVLIISILIWCQVVNCSNFIDFNDTVPVVVDKPDTVYLAYEDSIELIKDSIQEKLILEVQEYLSDQSPRAHEFIPKYIVDAGLKHDIDICFMMAQTQIETNFGTEGAGRESSRRSLFGVSIRKYKDYESAISDYCSLLKRSYLVKGRTEQHLMNRYVTKGGSRYATNPSYEVELKRVYRSIVAQTRISELQTQYNELLEKDNET